MKFRSFTAILIVLMIGVSVGTSMAQDIQGGVVTYQQTKRYDFEEIFKVYADNDRVKDWIASLPTESRNMHILSFTPEKALFEEDPASDNALPRNLQGALGRAEFIRPPQKKLQKMYWDLTKNETSRQFEFMTRYFLVSGSIEKSAWKMTNKKIKIQDYICMGAELERGDDIATAYFTSEIPVSIGPADFSGLPGLIMAVEINGETVFIATSVDLTPPKNDALSEPDTGKKVTQAEFDEIVAEKEKEWKETRSQRGTDRR